MFQTLSLRRAALVDLKSFIRTTIIKNESTHSFKQVLLVKGDHSLRFDTLGVFGQPKGIFIYDNGKTVLYDTQQNQLYQGKEAWDLMKNIVGVISDFEEYISLLTGNVPRIENLKLIAAKVSSDQRVYRLEIQEISGESRFRIDMDALTRLPVKLVKISNLSEDYSVEWLDHRKLGDYSFPYQVVLTRISNGDKLVIKYQKPVINSGISHDAFHLSLSVSQPQS
ncbi:MAG: DUF4292 domain-containing protein [Nitrospinota bacterium]|nr:DUF4292 domain-containing protein [Nitrospinota bacterium]